VCVVCVCGRKCVFCVCVRAQVCELERERAREIRVSPRVSLGDHDCIVLSACVCEMCTTKIMAVTVMHFIVCVSVCVCVCVCV